MSNNDWINILCGFIGVLFVTIAKMESLRKDAEKANMIFDYKKYLQRDALSLISSLISVVVWFLLFGEAATKFKSIEGYTRFSFFVMGGMGAWVLQMLLSKTKNWIRQTVDSKTNELDEIKASVDKPPATT